MGVLTAVAVVSVDPVQYVSELNRQILAGNVGNPSVSALRGADDASQIQLELQWSDIETAKKNFDAAKRLIEKAHGTQSLTPPRVMSRV